MSSVSWTTVEFNRHGSPPGHLEKDKKYIRTIGWDTETEDISAGLDYRQFQRNLNALRYLNAASDSDVQTALELLGKEAMRFLEPVAARAGALLQVDVVTNAAELWALPFEACFSQHPEWLASVKGGVVVTRRIRGSFSDAAPHWPPIPKVLFVHAPVAGDLEQSLVDAHVEALVEALEPWSRGKLVVGSDLLAVQEVKSADEIAWHRNVFKPSCVHVLAHGAVYAPDPLSDERVWGLRLGDETARATSPDDIASALQPDAGLPLVVTLTACDSANQASPVFATRSVVQELHLRGIPVVVGSQLPLTMPGSQALTRTFYARLLQGEDVRVALHIARIDLLANVDAAHDWLSLVAYVRLPPEGYGAYLEEVGFKMELRMLAAVQSRADQLIASGGSPDDFAPIEKELRRRLASLEGRLARLERQDLREESHGLVASALKRLAELQFLRGLSHPGARDTDWPAARQMLARARDTYRAAFDADLRSHWLGAQQLALDAALNGVVSRPFDWLLVSRAAEMARDRRSANGKEDHWSCGTLAELGLIAPKAGQPRDLGKAKAAAALLVERARRNDDEWAIASTRRQIERYVRWWITDHGYFPGVEDLKNDAIELLESLN